MRVLDLEQISNSGIGNYVKPRKVGEWIDYLKIILNHCKHGSGVILSLVGYIEGQYQMNWDVPFDDFDLDMQRATELGAYAVACILIELETEYTVRHFSNKGGGYDFKLILKSTPNIKPNDYNFLDTIAPQLEIRTARLEVSGTAKSKELNSRAKEKEKQISVSHSIEKNDAFVIVTDFEKPLTLSKLIAYDSARTA